MNEVQHDKSSVLSVKEHVTFPSDKTLKQSFRTFNGNIKDVFYLVIKHGNNSH